jgi:uncharacterized tellurite resistance protein B-like protein
MLSRKNDDAKRQLSQKEREAIVDLLHFCMYGDAHIALKESEFISQAVDTLGWDTQLSFGSYETRSIAGARSARESADARQDFLARAAERLQAADVRSLAVDLCKQMMVADGNQTEKESAVIADITAALQ